MNVFLAVLWKDLISEWRSRDRAAAMLVFALLVVVTFHFAWPESDRERARALAPGLLWIAYLFAAILGLNRAFSVELENDAIAGLAMVPRDPDTRAVAVVSLAAIGAVAGFLPAYRASRLDPAAVLRDW